MKYIAVEFDDSVDLSAFPKKSSVTLSSTGEASEIGMVFMIADVVTPELILNGITVPATITFNE